MNGLDATLHLGGHLEQDFLDTDLLVVNPAVPKDMPLLRTAVAKGVRRTSEINLFLERCPGRLVGITGSVGKSTTTAMIGEILARRYTTHVGGNIGRSLLDILPEIRGDHYVVLELSSFQLEDTPLVGISPQVALVTNLLPNHLDRHGTMDAYGEAKKNIFRFQAKQDVLALNRACSITSAWAGEAPGQVDLFDPKAEPFDLNVPGDHNQTNAQAAWAVVHHCGIDRATAAAALKTFGGLSHRLQFVIEKNGVKYYNDSKCTTPDGAIVALNAFPPRKAILIVGGYDKHVSFDTMGQALAQRAKAVVALGATRRQIIDAVNAHAAEGRPTLIAADDFDTAVALARQQATPGDVVLLSPACASYDMFVNYEQRGQWFVELVTK